MILSFETKHFDKGNKDEEPTASLGAFVPRTQAAHLLHERDASFRHSADPRLPVDIITSPTQDLPLVHHQTSSEKVKNKKQNQVWNDKKIQQQKGKDAIAGNSVPPRSSSNAPPVLVLDWLGAANTLVTVTPPGDGYSINSGSSTLEGAILLIDKNADSHPIEGSSFGLGGTPCILANNEYSESYSIVSGSEFGGVALVMKDKADRYPPPHLHVPAGPELAEVIIFNENDAHAYPTNDSDSEVRGGFLLAETAVVESSSNDDLKGGKKISGTSYKNRKSQQRWRPHILNTRPRTLSLFRLLLCFFQAQILLTFLSGPFVAAADPAVDVVNNVVDHGDIMVSSIIPWLLVQFEKLI